MPRRKHLRSEGTVASQKRGGTGDLIASISRNAWLFLVGSFFLGLGVSLMWTFFNLYLREAGLGEGLIGQLLSANSLGAVLVAVPVAYLAGRLRFKTMLVVATILAAAAYTAAIVSLHALVLWLAFLLAGVFFTAHHVVGAPFFMRNSSPRERPYLFGWSFGIETAAWALGASCGGFVVTWFAALTGSVIWGYRLTLLGGVGLLLLAALPYALVRETGVAEEDRRPLSHFLVARDWALLGKLTLPTVAVGAGAGFVIPFLNLYFRDRFAIEVESIGLYFAGASALMTVGNFLGPWIARRIGLLTTVACSQLLSIPFMLILAFTATLPLAIVAFLLRSALMNMGHPMARNFAMEVVSEDEQAVTNSAESLAWNGGWMLSTVAGGHLIEAHGYLPSFLITTTLYLTSTMLYLVFFRDRDYRRIGIDRACATPAH